MAYPVGPSNSGTPRVSHRPAEKTNSMRLLEQRGVAYQAFWYDPALHSAVAVAEALSLPPERVYKTLVVLRDPPRGRPLLVMVPGPREADLRLLSRSLGEKALRMASRRDAERLTGLQAGGIGALALLGKGFEVYLDQTARELDWLLVNPGRRGVNVRLSVADLMSITGARPVAATRP